MSASFRLTVFEGDRLVRAPVILTEQGLRDILLTASKHDDARVNVICATAERHGWCEIFNDVLTIRFLVEKILHS